MATPLRMLRPLGAAFFLTLPIAALAQGPGVGIGTSTPNASAALDVSSTSKGLLPPRMTQTQRDAINPAATAAGLVIFNTSTGKLNTWNGTSWEASLSATEQPYQAPAVTFGYTGAPQTYTVPAGVTSLTVEAAGAGGGSGSNYYGPAASGGPGARVQATLAVVPGEVLTIYVGGTGGSAGAGGYNGGGPGSFDVYQGGGGGGASDVRRSAPAPSTALADRLLVAAGGGGTGASPFAANAGGGGGAPNGGTGATSGPPGQGATQTAGGNAGGTLGQGGPASSRAGGGGGYYGGGGGSFNAGGGGGSSWVTPTGSSAITMTGSYQTGNGSIVLTPGLVYAAPALDASNFVNLPTGGVTASNGLTKAGADIALGGPLTKATTIAQAGFNLNLSGTGNVGIGTGSSPAAKLTVQPATNAEVGLRVTNGVADGTAISGNIVLQTLTGGDSGFSFLGFNGYNTTAEARNSTSKNRWRLGVDQRGSGDGFFLDTYDGTTGVDVLRATTSGNLGIGNGTANSRLSISPSTIEPKLTLFDGGSTTTHYGFGISGNQLNYHVGGTTDRHVFWAGGKNGDGTELLRIQGNGNVGIGTSAPSQALEVAGNVKMTGTGNGLIFPDGTTQTTAATGGAAVTASNGLSKTGNDVALGGTLGAATTIAQAGNNFSLTGGNVGIGTSSPASRLYVRAADNSTNPIATFQPLNETQGVSLTYNGIAKTGSNATSTLTLDGKGSGNILLHTNGSTGNVGIGSSAPGEKLEVAGSVYTNGENSGLIVDSNGNRRVGLMKYSGREAGIWRVAGQDFEIGRSNRTSLTDVSTGTTFTTDLMVDGSGNVGLGTATPAARLHVAGTAGTSNVRLESLGGTGARMVTADASGNLSTQAIPTGTGTDSQTLTISGSTLSISNGNSVTLPSGGGAGDNLGNHTATQALNLGTNALTGTGSSISGIGVGVTAQGGLNMGQNAAGNGIFLGFQAGINNAPNTGTSPQQGTFNQFVGYQAGPNNTTGRQNVFTGAQSGFYNTSGSTNTFTGLQSGLTNTTGSNNTFSGGQSGYLNDAGNQNVFTGLQAGYSNTSGSNNTFTGTLSGYNTTTGNRNTALGYNSGPATGSGALTNTTTIGADAVVTQSNSVVLGNNANVGIGTSAPATRLDVNGNLRLAVRTLPTGPPPAATVLLQATDIAFSIYRTTPGAGNYVAGLRLPDAATGGQVLGQQFTVLNTATESTLTIEGTNTDNAAGVVLAAAGTAGVHGVMYVWGGTAWIRVQ